MADAGWLRTPRKFQPSQGAQTAPNSRGLGGWSSWVGEFVARQPVAAFHLPVVCESVPFASNSTRSGCPFTLATPTHPPHRFPIWMGQNQLRIPIIGSVRSTFVLRPH